MLTVAVIGSRDFKELLRVGDYLDSLRELVPDFWVISGGARGVDQEAVKWCKQNNVVFKEIRPRNPDWREEYLRRNIEIVAMADVVVAFWDGKSTGTKFTIDYASDRGKPLKVIMDG